MKDSLHKYKILESDHNECDQCNDKDLPVLFVEEIDESFCFNCYYNRYGLDRFLRRVKEFPIIKRDL